MFFFPKEPKRLLFWAAPKEAKKLVTASPLQDCQYQNTGHGRTQAVDFIDLSYSKSTWLP